MFRFEHENGGALQLPPNESVTIGRGEQCDLQLDDPAVSRVHCRAIASDGRVTLTDVGSRWGTFVNGRQVSECDLQSGDRVTIGETVLRLELDGDPTRTTMTPPGESLRTAGVSLSDPFPPPIPLPNPVEAESVPGISHHMAEPDSPAALRGEQSPEPASAMDAETNRSHPEIEPQTRSGSAAPVSSEFRIRKPMVSPEDFLGQSFLRYHVRKTITTTASGVVFLAIDTNADKPVALKIYHPQFFADDVAAMRFERAARTMFGARHPNIVELFNAGRKQGLCFTASQLIRGHSAVRLIRNAGVAGMLEPAAALRMAVDLCEALRFAESRKIVHRNIKPSNILIRDSDQTALLNDLILAKATTGDAQQLTQAGEVLGDVSFLSPEQLGSGPPVDCRSDVYQLGATLYAILAGRPPFDGGTFGETIAQVLTSQPRPIREFHMATPEPFDALILRMLEKDPNHRIQNADELATALGKVSSSLAIKDVRSVQADPNASGWGGALDGIT